MHYKRAADPLPFSNSIKKLLKKSRQQKYVSHLNTISQGKLPKCTTGKAAAVAAAVAPPMGPSVERVHPPQKSDTNLT